MSRRTTKTPWRPFGAARRAFEELPPEQAASEAFFEAVLTAAGERFDLGPEHVALAWTLAGWQPGLDDPSAVGAELASGLGPRSARRCLFLVTLVTLVDQAQGSTRSRVLGDAGGAHLARVLAELLPGDDAAVQAKDQAQAIQSLLGEHADLLPVVLAVLDAPPETPPPQPLVLEGEFLYHQKLLLAEERLTADLRARLAATPAPAFTPAKRKKAVEAVLKHAPVFGTRTLELAAEQTLALGSALERSLTLISGGPGTGKTSIVVTILRVLIRLGLSPAELALAAPTGKAAQRLQESIQAGLAALPSRRGADKRLADELPEAQTLHRLLGAARRGNWFRHHEHNPLSARVVIVDEASMIDLHLFDRLLRAVRPDARLIVLGDAEQLPAVGSGAVLRDLIPPAGDTAHPLAGFAVRLTQNFRMDASDPHGAAILTLAQQIHAGEPLALGERAGVDALTFAGAEAVLATPGRDDLGPFLSRWYQRVASLEDFPAKIGHTFALADGAFTAADQARLDELFAHYGRSRILCPTRVHKTGVRAINRSLHVALLVATKRRGAYAFCPGEPVLMTVNDYEQGLFNGDQGLILWVQAGPDARTLPQAVFNTRSGYRAFPLDLLETRLEHAWALTVHKAQGSEFDHVALVLPPKDTPLLTREVVYTAVTRARRSVTVLGKRELLELACGRTVQRSCGVAERLSAQP